MTSINGESFVKLPTAFMLDPWYWEKPARVRVWVYFKHAEDWTTGAPGWPGYRRCAKTLGYTNKEHVRRTILELLEHGDLVDMGPGPGRSRKRKAVSPVHALPQEGTPAPVPALPQEGTMPFHRRAPCPSTGGPIRDSISETTHQDSEGKENGGTLEGLAPGCLSLDQNSEGQTKPQAHMTAQEFLDTEPTYAESLAFAEEQQALARAAKAKKDELR